MYPVSEAFLAAVQENVRKYFWTGRITTKAGAVYEFGAEDIVKGTRQTISHRDVLKKIRSQKNTKE